MSVTSTATDQIGLTTIAGRIVPAMRGIAGTLAAIGRAGAETQTIDRLWHLSDAELADRGFKHTTLVEQIIRHRG